VVVKLYAARSEALMSKESLYNNEADLILREAESLYGNGVDMKLRQAEPPPKQSRGNYALRRVLQLRLQDEMTGEIVSGEREVSGVTTPEFERILTEDS
jgi:hypothetical protein